MRIAKIGIICAGFALSFGAYWPAQAEQATAEDMQRVCRNWLAATTHDQGTWAGSPEPTITSVREFFVGDTLLARCFALAPRGFILVPVLKELPPVKAYSEKSNFDVDQTFGIPQLLRDVLTARMRNYRDTYGSLDASQPATGTVLLGRRHREHWNRYLMDPEQFDAEVARGSFGGRTQVGELISTNWHQGDPYDDDCPMGDGGRCAVGCVATATAQILRYHASPATVDTAHIYHWDGDGDVPGQYLYAEYMDGYDWDNMPDDCDNGCSDEEEAALAELCYEVGVAFEMNYGFDASGTQTWKACTVLPAFFRYQKSIVQTHRDGPLYADDRDAWYAMIVEEIDAGRPLLYRIRYDNAGGHAIVCDGWRNTYGSDEYHINYGWGGDRTTWYTVDTIYKSDPIPEEYVVRHIKPYCLLRDDGEGDYPTIQAAVDAALDRDVIELADGVYTGPGNRGIACGDKQITIRSQSGNPAECIIDCEGEDRAFNFTDEQVLTGVTVRNGHAPISGGAILCTSENPPTIENCIFDHNTAAWYGGAIRVYSGSSPLIENCTFVQNSALYGSALYFSGGSDGEVYRSIMAFNNGGKALYCESGSVPWVECCNIYGNAGGDWTGSISMFRNVHDNMEQDPLFCDFPMDLWLGLDSPCNDEFSPCGVYMGALPDGCPNQGGACCRGLECEVTTTETCGALGGVWHMGLDCDPSPCVAVCCLGSACDLLCEGECTGLGGVWHPEWESCESNPCNVAACCVGLNCQITNIGECGDLGGVWHPGWDSCSPSPCPAVCCVGGSCYVIPEDECLDLSGVRNEEYGASCEPNPCEAPPPVAACCVDGDCHIGTEENCGGTWLEGITTCDPNPCSGVCCLDGQCHWYDQASCDYVGGTWQAGSSCDPNPCPADVAACCYQGTCTITEEPSCQGTWHFEWESCDPNPCPEYSAACCVGSTCFVLTQAMCAAVTGTWYPGSETCSPNPCPAACCTGIDCQLLNQAVCDALGGDWYPTDAACEPVNPCPAVCCIDGECQFVAEILCDAYSGQWHPDGISCSPNPCFHIVRPDGLGDYTTIQEAIDSVSDYEVIALTNGVFDVLGHQDMEPNGIDFKGKAITLFSLSGDPEACIIDCENAARGFNFHTNEQSGSRLEGVTIRMGTSLIGGGILCDGASPSITNCILEECASTESGGGIACQNGASPLIQYCQFRENWAGQNGGGLWCSTSSGPWIGGCIFSENTAEMGGAIYAEYNSSSELLGCTLYGNTATIAGAGIYFSECYGTTLVDNTLIAFSPQGEAIGCDSQSVPTLNCCDLYGNDGGDWTGYIADQFGGTNIDEDPLFCGAPDNLHVCQNSPCLPENMMFCDERIGALGQGCASCGTGPADLNDGVLIAHHPPGLQYTSPTPPGGWCQAYQDEFRVAGCHELDAQIDLAGDAVWYVLAAWNDAREWCEVEFGLGAYDPQLFAFDSWGSCFPGLGLETPTGGWPGPNAGISLETMDTPWAGNYEPVVWFAGYTYTAGVIPLSVHCESAFAGTRNCMSPAADYDAVCLGEMGLIIEGTVCCPDSPAQPYVCCLGDGTCQFVSLGECDLLGGEWHPEYETCDPNPCTQLSEGFSDWQPLMGVSKSDAAWGDFDGNGSLDLIICGESDSEVVSRTYKNNAGVLGWHQDLVGIAGSGSGCLAWGDYDADGDLDLAIAGLMEGNERIARVYTNNGIGDLEWDSGQILVGVSDGSVAWGDTDNDGDLDLLIMGYDGTRERTILYVNDAAGSLTADEDATLLGLSRGSADWGDIDHDGDLDLVLTGADSTSTARALVYMNVEPGNLVEDGGHGLAGVFYSDAAWGDCDADGDLDLAITGTDGTNRLGRVYLNDGSGNFTQQGTELLAASHSSCAWGDYDSDGLLDVAFCGDAGTEPVTEIFRNTGTGFEQQSYEVSPAYDGSLSWADVDQDGNLDLLVTGADGRARSAMIYERTGGTPNSAPSPPNAFTSEQTEYGPHLTWAGATDGETPAPGLSYCLRVGRWPGGDDVVSGTFSSLLLGNQGQTTDLRLRLPPDAYYWSVRAIDAGLMASAWCEEQVCVPPSIDYADHNVGNCVLTVTDQGILGFMDGSQLEGTGFVYPSGGSNSLYLGGLWAGASDAYVANRDYDADPAKEWIVSSDPDGHIWIDLFGSSDQDIHASYTDSASVAPLGLLVEQVSWAFGDDQEADDFVVLHYTISSLGDEVLDGLYLGCFLDIDVGTYTENWGSTDAGRALVYLTDVSDLHAGVCLLQDAAAEPPLANLALIHNPTYVYPETFIQDAHKYGFLSANDPQYVVPDAPDPDDYSVLVSAGPFTLTPGEDRCVSFAILGGESMEDLLLHADMAQTFFVCGQQDAPDATDPVMSVTRLWPNNPNPFGRTTEIRFCLSKPGNVRLGIHDINGRVVRELARGWYLPQIHVLSWDGCDNEGRAVASGMYFVQLLTDDQRAVRRLVRLR